jgi:hypothetical protein
MISVQPVSVSQFTQVYPLLREMDPTLDESSWQRLFNPRWERAESHCGYGLFDGEELVGFIGLIFSQRMIDLKTEHFCNITTWIVQPPYRGYSLSLMRSVMKLKDYTLTDFSSYQEVIQLSKRLGFQALDLRVELLFTPRGLLAFFSRSKIHFFQDPAEIKTRLQGEDLRLFTDHQIYPNCRHLLVCHDRQYCYIIFTIVPSWLGSYCYLHFMSNISFFAEYSLAIRAQLAKVSQTSLILVDSRLVSQVNLPFTYELPLNCTKLYRSSTLKPEQIDNLYSELILLNLNVLPRNWTELWQNWRDRLGL